MTLKPWREIAVPHEDVHRGTFQQAEFAADITQVHTGRASEEYKNPSLFFQRTFITEGMAALLTSVAQRLSGKGGDPVIQLQTAFGGGKTHTMLAVMHMAGGKAAASDMAGIPGILDKANVMTLPTAKIVVLDGTNLAPNQPRKVDGQQLRTLWGELAWQLGGAEAFAKVADSDASGTSPGKSVLVDVLKAHAPAVILVDELVRYISQFEGSAKLTGGTFDSNLSFIQSLTEALKEVPTATMLASLPESEREAGSDRGIQALKSLEHYFGRVQAIWKPVAAEEAFEIVRRRLFTTIVDRTAADAVCRAFADHYVKHADDLPGETQEGRYYDRMRAAYPIHPEVFERLYRDWSALPNFQRTRGVLKLMARVIHALWQNNNQDLLLMPGSLPMADRDVHGELVSYLPAGWDPVIEREVDGDRSYPADIEIQEVRFGAIQACRRVTRSIFLGSAPTSTNEMARGIETERVILSCLQPGQAPHLYRDALVRLETRLTFLNKGTNRWWFDVRPNLRREMEDRKRRFTEQDVVDAIRDALQRVTGQMPFEAVHVFTPASDVPDDWGLRLVVLPPSSAWTRNGPNPARELAATILRTRGEQPRQKQNRLLFLAADADQVSHLKDTIRALLAWRSIEEDVGNQRMTLDNLQSKQATQNRMQTHETVLRLVRETFKWLITPSQAPNKDGGLGDIEWDAHTINPAAQSLGNELGRVLNENELVVHEWAPIHLHALLQKWFWKDGVVEIAAQDVWQKSCQYLYFPRLAKSPVMQSAIAAGATSRDFFGLAYGKNENGYQGFSLGQATSPLMDALLLIEPKHAAKVAESLRLAQEATSALNAETRTSSGPSVEATEVVQGHASGGATTGATATARPTRYYGTADLNPVTASLEFQRLVSELVELFSANPGTQVRLRVDIEAEDTRGFSETIVRAAKENGRTLRMKTSDFD